MPMSSMWSRPKASSFPRCARSTATRARTTTVSLSFIERQGIELVYTEKIAPALGMSYGGRIAILPGQSKAEDFRHACSMRLAHEMLHKAERRTTTTKVVRETEAEAIAFVVGKAVGLEVGTASRRLHRALSWQRILAD